MDRFNVENFRLLAVSCITPILAVFTPTKPFILALIATFAFNVICGMRSDGITINRCKNFSMKKFSHALVELLIYIMLVQLIYSTMKLLGDKEIGAIAIKSLTYVFIYVYIQNALKNLIKSNPSNKAFHMVYFFIRFEFAKLLPSYLKPLFTKFKELEDKEEAKNEK